MTSERGLRDREVAPSAQYGHLASMQTASRPAPPAAGIPDCDHIAGCGLAAVTRQYAQRLDTPTRLSTHSPVFG
jgi:hypothetical protein